MTRSAIQLTVILAAMVAGLLFATAETKLPARTNHAVYDLAGIIDEPSEAALEALSRELYDKTGVALVIITVSALEDETIDELAVRVGHTWGVGSKGRDRGLVVALARADREIFVATGYGTEGYLPDGKLGRLISETAVPFLRVGRFSDGLIALSTALAQASADEYQVALNLGAPPPTPPRRPAGPVQILFIVVGLLVLGFLAWRHPGLFFFFLLLAGRGGGPHGGGFGGGGGFRGFGGGGFGGGGGGRGF